MKLNKTENDLLKQAVYNHTEIATRLCYEMNVIATSYFNGVREYNAARKLEEKGLISIVNEVHSLRDSTYGSFVIKNSRGVYDIMGRDFYMEMHNKVCANLPNNHPNSKPLAKESA